MAVAGSDCPTGKIQYATRETASGSAHILRAHRGGTAAPFRCAWCECWHVGNRRADSSKGRQRR
jgi:hypothetical protein